MKKILTREQFLDSIRTQRYTKYTGISSTNEALSNEINWGDSLVGRLINSIMRKAKVSINLRRVDSLTKRLRALFDELVETGKIDIDQSTYSFLTTLAYFDVLADKVSNEEEIPAIIGHIDTMISQLESYNLEKKEILISKLNEFREFLKSSQGEKEETEEVEKEEVVESKIKIDDLFNNLTLLKNVLVSIKTVSIEGVAKEPTSGKGVVGKGAGFSEDEMKSPNFAIYKNDKNQIRTAKVASTQSAVSGSVSLENIPRFESFAMSKKKILNIVPPIKKGTKIKVKQGSKELIGQVELLNGDKLTLKLMDGGKFSFNMRDTDFIVVESVLFENFVIKKDDMNSIKVFNKLKSAASILELPKDKGLGIDVKWLDLILSKKSDVKVQEIVSGIYKTVWAYLLGDKKVTLNPDTKKLFEDFIDEYKLDAKYGYGVGKTQIAAEKIARFYYTCLKFTSENPLDLKDGDIGGYKLLGDLGTKLKELNASTINILKSKGEIHKSEESVEIKVGDKVSYQSDEFGKQEKEVVKVEGDKVTLKGEKGEFEKNIKDVTKVSESIFRYSNFIKINEAVDYDAISDEFERIFNDDVKEQFKLTEETQNKLKELVKSRDSIVITNSDSIMEIVRLFNRAWRIHTPGRIPSGRTGGKVSMSVFQEYENLGEGSGSPEEPGAGPYRNIELFEKWNESVLSILGDTKYRTTIFSDDAKFVFVSGEVAKRPVTIESITKGEREIDVEKSRPLGKILLRFINSLLADTQMYKDKGAMPRFLEEYFGIKNEDIKGLSYPKFNDAVKNPEIATGIVTPNVGFESMDKITEKLKEREKDNKDNKNIILRIKFKDENTFTYFRILEFKENVTYLQMFNSFPLERVNCKNIRNLIPTSMRIVSFNNRTFDIGKVLQTKQSKFDFLRKDKFIDEVEQINKTIKKMEVLKTEDGDEFFTDSKYLFEKIKKKNSEPETKKNVNSLIKKIKF